MLNKKVPIFLVGLASSVVVVVLVSNWFIDGYLLKKTLPASAPLESVEKDLPDPSNTPAATVRTASRKTGNGWVWQEGKWERKDRGIRGTIISTGNPDIWEGTGEVVVVENNTTEIAFGKNCESDYSNLRELRRLGSVCGTKRFSLTNAIAIEIPAYLFDEYEIPEEFRRSELEVGDWVTIAAHPDAWRGDGGEMLTIRTLQ